MARGGVNRKTWECWDVLRQPDSPLERWRQLRKITNIVPLELNLQGLGFEESFSLWRGVARSGQLPTVTPDR